MLLFPAPPPNALLSLENTPFGLNRGDELGDRVDDEDDDVVVLTVTVLDTAGGILPSERVPLLLYAVMLVLLLLLFCVVCVGLCVAAKKRVPLARAPCPRVPLCSLALRQRWVGLFCSASRRPRHR